MKSILHPTRSIWKYHRFASSQASTLPGKLVGEVTFLGHSAPLLDVYVSFARQAAQAMTIHPSKTIFPIRTTPDIAFCPETYPAKSSTDTAAGPAPTQDSLGHTKGLSFTQDRWTVNRSPFVHGRHQDQFEIRTYQRRLELFNAHPETVKRWLHYVSMNLPPSIGFEYIVHTEERIDLSDTPSQTEKGPEHPPN